MIGRFALGFVPLGLGGAFYSGAIPIGAMFGASGYETTLEASPAQVRSAIRDLEFTEIEYGGLPASSAAIDVVRRSEEQQQVWEMRVEGRPAFRFVANLIPSADGKRTQVRSETQFIEGFNTEGAPLAFRTLDIPQAVFAAALEEELNDLQPEAQRLTPRAAELRRSEKVTNVMMGQIITNPMAIGAQARQMELEMRADIDEAERNPSGVSARREAEVRERYSDVIHRGQASYEAASRDLSGSRIRPEVNAARPSVDASRPSVDLSR